MHVNYHCLSSSPSSMPHGTIVALQNVSIATRSTAHSSNLWHRSTSPYLTIGHSLSKAPSSILPNSWSFGKKGPKKVHKTAHRQREFSVRLYLYNVVHPIKGWGHYRVHYVNSAWLMRMPPLMACPWLAHGKPPCSPIPSARSPWQYTVALAHSCLHAFSVVVMGRALLPFPNSLYGRVVPSRGVGTFSFPFLFLCLSSCLQFPLQLIPSYGSTPLCNNGL